MKSARILFKPDAPNELWQTDITYVWCRVDGWCHCLNVVNMFVEDGFGTPLMLQHQKILQLTVLLMQ